MKSDVVSAAMKILEMLSMTPVSATMDGRLQTRSGSTSDSRAAGETR
jgi:hypothetical protein